MRTPARRPGPHYGREGPPAVPDTVEDQTVTAPRGEVTYVLTLDDEEVEALAVGELLADADVARRCHSMLEWKRRHYRLTGETVPPTGYTSEDRDA
ncbi:MAG: hypothetical protein V4597_08280 [Pseudomonadota bacterium]